MHSFQKKMLGCVGIWILFLSGTVMSCRKVFPSGAPDGSSDSLFESQPIKPLPRDHVVANLSIHISDRVAIKDASIHDNDEIIRIRMGDILRVIRKFDRDTLPFYLVANASNYSTHVVRAEEFDALTRVATQAEADSSALSQSLKRAHGKAFSELNSSLPGEKKPDVELLALTVDMCQSDRKTETGFFKQLIALSGQMGRPIPVGIAMTGLWAQRHPSEFLEMKGWQQNNKLDIIWINHSFHHRLNYKDGKYLFLTAPGVHFQSEVLEMEKLFLEQGIRPSLLFRFPGLVHDSNTLAELAQLSLVAIDANAWLALDQVPRNRSIILVHGNGNEPVGIELFLKLLPGLRRDLISGVTNLVSPQFVMPFYN